MSVTSRRDLAVVLAGAGDGVRMGPHGPKLLLELAGRTLLERVASIFLAHPSVGELIAVVPESLLEPARRALTSLPASSEIRRDVTPGGPTRRESVARGLEALTLGLPYVAVHDVARALVEERLITRVLETARLTGAAIPAVPLRDTVTEVDAGRVVRTLDRARLFGVQTPQIFADAILRRAHATAQAEGRDATDDASLLDASGAKVAVVPGDPMNLKLTEPSDLAMFEFLLRRGTT
ncbi:MAG TPA: 2-C-methyl-D-erythritol 4-phosphate cytidylyltransferase [Candidatus Eisenbacteria bacterium]|nr:2-C-methyl-D-erythritol 4-phosphate cytidylyltransferase [Candidatus Eisenbacteria bacterium]